MLSCQNKRVLTFISAIEHITIQKNHRSHGFHDGNGTGQDTGIVASASLHRHSISGNVHGLLLTQKSCHGLKSNTEVDVFAVADASLNAATSIRERADASVTSTHEDVVLLAASLSHASETGTIFKPFHGIDAEHGSTQASVKFTEHRLTESRRTAFDDTADDAANRVTFCFDLGNELRHFLCHFLIRTAHGVAFNERKVKVCVGAGQRDVTNLRGVGSDADAQAT